MFQDISYYIPLEKELKERNLPKNNYVEILTNPSFIPFTECYIDGKYYYNFIVDHTLIEKIEDEIRYEREKKEKGIRKYQLRFEREMKKIKEAKDH